LKQYILTVEAELAATDIESTYDQHGVERHLDAKQDPQDPTKFILGSYSRETIVHFDHGKFTIE
jgi:hypothetical protein